MAKRYDATKPLAIAGFHIRDSHMMNRWLTVPETLIHSSTIVTAQIGDQLGRAKMEELFRSLGFDGRPHIELTERAFPLWPNSWGRVTTMTTRYGQGIAVTPLHPASPYAPTVNAGHWRPAPPLTIRTPAPPPGHRAFKAAPPARHSQP